MISLLDTSSFWTKAAKREIACLQDLNKSFKKGLDLEGLKDHSISGNMQLLKHLQESVDIMTDEDYFVPKRMTEKDMP